MNVYDDNKNAKKLNIKIKNNKSIFLLVNID